MNIARRLCALWWVGVLGSVWAGGCESTPQAIVPPVQAGKGVDRDDSQPDPSVRVALGESTTLVEQRQGMKIEGVVRSFAVRGTHNQLMVYFEARTDAPHHKDLAAYSAWADRAFKDREIRRVNVGATHNPARDAGLASVASAYVNIRRPGGSAPKSICDAAGFRFETPGGYWTISCNSDLGKIDEALPAIDECLRVMKITRIGSATK